MLYLSRKDKRIQQKQLQKEQLDAAEKLALEELQALLEARRMLAGRPLGKLDSHKRFR